MVTFKESCSEYVTCTTDVQEVPSAIVVVRD